MLWESPFYPSQCQQFVTFCKEMYETLTRPRYNLGQKVLRILLFLTHRRPTLRIWNHGDPSPTPPWSMLFSRQQKCSGHTSTLLFWGEGGISWVNRALEGSILKLHIQRAFFLTFLSKIVARVRADDSSNRNNVSRSKRGLRSSTLLQEAGSLIPAVPHILEK